MSRITQRHTSGCDVRRLVCLLSAVHVEWLQVMFNIVNVIILWHQINCWAATVNARPIDNVWAMTTVQRIRWRLSKFSVLYCVSHSHIWAVLTVDCWFDAAADDDDDDDDDWWWSSVALCQAKRIVSYVAHAKPERLVDEVIGELRVCQFFTVCWQSVIVARLSRCMSVHVCRTMMSVCLRRDCCHWLMTATKHCM